MSQWMLWPRDWRGLQANDFWLWLDFGWSEFTNFEQESHAWKYRNKIRQDHLVLKVWSWPWIRQPAICNIDFRLSKLRELAENIGGKLWVVSDVSRERKERRVYFSKACSGVYYFLEWRQWSLVWNTDSKFSLKIALSEKDYTCRLGCCQSNQRIAQSKESFGLWLLSK